MHLRSDITLFVSHGPQYQVCSVFTAWLLLYTVSGHSYKLNNEIWKWLHTQLPHEMLKLCFINWFATSTCRSSKLILLSWSWSYCPWFYIFGMHLTSTNFLLCGLELETLQFIETWIWTLIDFSRWGLLTWESGIEDLTYSWIRCSFF